MHQLGREAVLSFGQGEATDGLVRLLMVVERADWRESGDQEGPSLSALVSRNRDLQRRLFWADVEETRKNADRGESHPTRFWQVHFHGGTLWRLESSDLGWLFADLAECFFEDDKRIALSAIAMILGEMGKLGEEVPRLRELVAGSSELERDLATYLAPPSVSKEERRLDREERRHREERDEQERDAKASWVKFRDKLQSDPTVLCDSSHLAKWSSGAVVVKEDVAFTRLTFLR